MDRSNPRTALRMERLVALVRDVPMDRYQIAAALHMAPRHALKYVDDLNQPGKLRRIRIAGWRGRVPLYQAGAGHNARRPPRLTDHERIRADPDKWERWLARQRARRLRPVADPLHNWMR